VVLLLSTFWDLVYAVGIGLVIASLMFMKKMGDSTAERSDVKPLKEEKLWIDEYEFPDNLKEEVFIKHIKGPLFFGSTSDFQQLAKQIPRTASTVVIRMDRMQYIDQSGLYALEDVLVDLRKDGINVLLVDVLPQPLYLLESVDLIPNLIPREHIFKNFKDCLGWIKLNVKDKFK
jgi:SulP family sulfate permease